MAHIIMHTHTAATCVRVRVAHYTHEHAKLDVEREKGVAYVAGVFNVGNPVSL